MDFISDIRTYFRKEGFKQFILKTVFFVILLIVVSGFSKFVITSRLFSIPSIFYLELPNIKTIFINAVLISLVAFIILSYKKLLNLPKYEFKKTQYLFIFLAVLLFAFHYYYRYLIHQNLGFFTQSSFFWALLRYIIDILFVLALAFSIYGFRFITDFVSKFRNQILLFSLVAISFFGLMLLVQNLWTYFSGAISHMLYGMFSIFFNDVVYTPFVPSFTMAEGGGPLLGVNGFSAIIGKPCSGIDSFLLFTSLYALIFILDYRRLKKPPAVAAFCIGVVGMFLTNLVRIFLLFIVGVYISPSFAVGLFHTNIGWIVFIVYFVIFWIIASKYIYAKK